jgi:hypothetical protein
LLLFLFELIGVFISPCMASQTLLPRLQTLLPMVFFLQDRARVGPVAVTAVFMCFVVVVVVEAQIQVRTRSTASQTLSFASEVRMRSTASHLLSFGLDQGRCGKRPYLFFGGPPGLVRTRSTASQTLSSAFAQARRGKRPYLDWRCKTVAVAYFGEA